MSSLQLYTLLPKILLIYQHALAVCTGGGRPAPSSSSTPSIGCDVLRSTAAVSRSTASEVNGQRVAVIVRVASADESWFYTACDNCLKS